MIESKFSVHAEFPLHELSPIVVLTTPVQASSPWHDNSDKVGSEVDCEGAGDSVGAVDGLSVGFLLALSSLEGAFSVGIGQQFVSPSVVQVSPGTPLGKLL